MSAWKSRLLALLVAAAATPARASDDAETLFKSPEKIDVRGWGAPVAKFSTVDDDFALFIGGRGAWVFEKLIVLGGGGYGLVNDIDHTIPADVLFGRDRTGRIETGYGGGILGVVLFSDSLIHGEILALVGGGSIDIENDDRGDDGFFVVEPEVNAELNVTHFFRVGAGFAWRFVSGISTPGLDNDDVGGPAAQVVLKFGKF